MATRQQKRELFQGSGRLDLTLHRLLLEVVEVHPGLQDTCLVGIQPRGVFLSRRLVAYAQKEFPELDINYGELDVTFHRDDFRRKGSPLVPNTTKIDFLIEEKDVILIDDVLFSGRTVRAALSALLAFGRPRSVELLVLVNRKRSRHYPIEPAYTGIAVDTLVSENVVVELTETHQRDSIRIESNLPN